jgi:hypothetical protein
MLDLLAGILAILIFTAYHILLRLLMPAICTMSDITRTYKHLTQKQNYHSLRVQSATRMGCESNLTKPKYLDLRNEGRCRNIGNTNYAQQYLGCFFACFGLFDYICRYVGVFGIICTSSYHQPIPPIYVKLVLMNNCSDIMELKCITLVVVNLAGFFCFSNATRYFNHVGFSIQIIPKKSETRAISEEPINVKSNTYNLHADTSETIDHVAKLLNFGNLYFTIGLRLTFLSFPCVLWY